MRCRDSHAVLEPQEPPARSSKPSRPPRALLGLLVLAVLAGCADDATRLVRPAAAEVFAGASDGTAHLAVAPGQDTGEGLRAFRWLEPVGTGGNALGAATPANSDVYLPYLVLDVCPIATPAAPCGPPVAGSQLSAALGTLQLTADGKSYRAQLALGRLGLAPTTLYRVRVQLADPRPGGVTRPVGAFALDVSGSPASGASGAGPAGPSGVVATTPRTTLPLRFVLGEGVARSLVLAPGLDTLTVRRHRSYTATVLDWADQPLPETPVRWALSDSTLATVASASLTSQAAEVTARAAGRTTLQAEADGLVTSVTLTLLPEFVGLVADPSPITVSTGDTAVIRVRGLAPDGAVRDLPGVLETGLTVRAISDIPAVASSSVLAATATEPAARVRVVGGAPGSTVVTVSYGTLRLAVPVSVRARQLPLAFGPKAALGATYLPLTVGDEPSSPISVSYWDARGLPLEGVVTTWTSSDPAVIAVDANGYVRPGVPGYAIITATGTGAAAGLQATCVALVLPASTGGPVRWISQMLVLPQGVTLSAGDTARLVAVPLDQNGAPVRITDVLWTSGSTTAALAPSPDGTVLVTGVAAGSGVSYATITARLAVPDARGTIYGSGLVTVNTTAAPGPEAGGSLAVTPSAISLASGATTTVRAVVRAATGSVLPGLGAMWTVGNEQVATVAAVSSDGTAILLRATGSGVTTLLVQRSGLAPVQVPVTVAALPPASPEEGVLTVTPTAATITQSFSSCVDLTAHWTVGDLTTDVTSQVRWTSGSDRASVSGGRVCGTNLITNGRPASVTITAGYGTTTATAAITVLP